MNTPVSFELSKLLKEKGFDEPCRYVHDTWDNIKDWLDGGEGEHRNSHKNGSVYYSAPTIAEVVMWLYEKHGIWVNVSIENNEDDKVSFYFSLLQNDNEVVFKLRQSNYNSPTEAYEAAIKYTLENLM